MERELILHWGKSVESTLGQWGKQEQKKYIEGVKVQPFLLQEDLQALCQD